MWNGPRHNMHDKHRLGVKTLTLKHFISAYRKVKPSFGPLPKNIIPTGKTQKRCVKSSEGGAVDSVRLPQFKTVMLALIPD